MHPYNNTSFARHAAKTALANNQNAININNNNIKHTRQPPAIPIHNQQVQQVQQHQQGEEIDKIVESVTNATKRLSQISTNTNNSKRKSKNHVGPWKLGRTLGRGSTGRVRLAKHSESGQLAAVKIVPKSKFQSDNNSTTSNSPYGIEREIIIMKLISHENIMALYDVWENKGELYLVLEYVEGGELFDYLIKKGRLQEKEAIHYFKQIINGVNYCHQFNICHRDLKPENLLLDKNLNIKIADFGMAALEINSKLLETSCGSPHYASPEIVTGKNYHGSPSDVWSCGIILFALLTGHLPFDDENIRKLLIKVQNGKFIMPNYLSKDAKDLIWKMLKINPNDRINIKDILNHPLLTKYNESPTISNSTKTNSINDYYSKIDKLSLTEDDIDSDILKSLSILFHGATQSLLISKLLESNSNPEKIFYYLLNDYKIKHQIKDQQNSKIEILHKNSKKKIGNGDGLLKKSKSLIKTTITNEDGSQTINYKQEPISRPITQVPKLPISQDQRNSSSTTTSSTVFGITSNNGRSNSIKQQTIPNSSSQKSTISKTKKRISKNQMGQFEIPVSNSYRRGVSFNNKDNIQGISRSSSKKSFTSINEKLKKNISLLPPLPDVGIDWLDENSKEGKDELALLCEEIFNYKDQNSSLFNLSPNKKRVSPRKNLGSSPVKAPRTLNPKREVDNLLSKQDTVIIKKEFKEEPKIPKDEISQSYSQISSSTITPTKLKKEEDKLHIPRQNNFEVNNSSMISTGTTKRYSSEPLRTLKPKLSTLDPKYKKRGISNDNAQILGKFGVKLNNQRNSKIYYSKSSTSINLSAILKNEFQSNDSKPNLPKIKNEEFVNTSDFRISSSNYNSEIDDSFDTINQTPSQFIETHYEDDEEEEEEGEQSFDFEVPTKTEIATAIQFSNGSNLTVQRNNYEDSTETQEDNNNYPYNSNYSNSILDSHSFINKNIKRESMFEDVESSILPNNENFLELSNSKSSVIKHHKRAISSKDDDFQDLLQNQEYQSQTNDYRGSLYQNSNNTKDENLPIIGRLSKIYKNKKHSILEQDEFKDETNSTILDNSIFADDTIDETDVKQVNNNNARVTTIFDDDTDQDHEHDQGLGITQQENNSYETVGVSSVVYSPGKQNDGLNKRQNSQLKRSPLRAMNGGTLRTSIVSPKIESKEFKDLDPKRDAPKLPLKDDNNNNNQEPKKINWFTKLFNNLLSNNHTTSTTTTPKRVNPKNIKIFKSPIPMIEIKKAIKLIIQIRIREGTLSLLSETSDKLIARTIASSSLSKSLKFEIFFNEQLQEIQIFKINGSLKLFKKLIDAMEFIIDNEIKQFNQQFKNHEQEGINGGNIFRSEIQV
ncbi:Serine/threonine-protein kinase [Wickerhamomyces ciferrii]|uniref:non-specific serine/threonine protein kinase n=1 Tax=Wickerhamomyces ciferrii (strain ATCC 14091 / BCRC 22168 / CBS 111 / JCM 3599 / NBRC 0793 / NRRL Y-1031 F-60-10) TaxID=1206466 RepID=K0KWK6_WICCF|nr:Serine/threonine-protein kinase [Wickerhamomyces ciferrii]CCH46392.1 Serine/threonine-protein kinase [Wickerhamomyces ciferrii]